MECFSTSSLRVVLPPFSTSSLGIVGGSSSLRIVQPRRGNGALLNLKTTAAHRLQASAVHGPSGLHPDNDKRAEKVYTWREVFGKQLQEFEKDMPFREDIEKTDEYAKKTRIIFWDNSMLYLDGRVCSFFCKAAKNGVRLASGIMLLHKEDVISHIAKQMLEKEVSIFVEVAEKAYNKKLDYETAVSCFRALRAVVSVGRILLQDALDKPNHIEYSSSIYSQPQDPDKIWGQFEKSIKNLETEFWMLHYKNSKEYESFYSKLGGATLDTEFALANHERVLGYVVTGTKGRRRFSRASGDEKPGASKTGSSPMSDD